MREYCIVTWILFPCVYSGWNLFFFKFCLLNRKISLLKRLTHRKVWDSNNLLLWTFLVNGARVHLKSNSLEEFKLKKKHGIQKTVHAGFVKVPLLLMNRKISRNEKHKYSNEEKLALGKNENTSAPQTLPRRVTSTFLNCYKTCE